MSEYTSYAIVHVDDLKNTCDELARNKVTSVFLPDYEHRLYKSKKPEAEWNLQPYENKWLILMTKDEKSNDLDFLPLSVYLTINEDQDTWLLKLYKQGEKVEFLFSDSPWGDMSSLDQKDDWSLIESSKNISDEELFFMEKLFQVESEKFSQYLKTGEGMAWNFLKAVGLPASEMECDWDFYYPKCGNDRCMLWSEYFKIVS